MQKRAPPWQRVGTPIGKGAASSSKGDPIGAPIGKGKLFPYDEGTVIPRPGPVILKRVKRELEPAPPAGPPPRCAVTQALSAASAAADMDQQYAEQAERDEGDMRLGAVELVSSQNMHS